MPVELIFGRGVWWTRLAIGVGFTVLDVALYLACLKLAINVLIATGPPSSSSGPAPLVFMALAAWIVPAARLWWLRRTRGR